MPNLLTYKRLPKGAPCIPASASVQVTLLVSGGQSNTPFNHQVALAFTNDINVCLVTVDPVQTGSTPTVIPWQANGPLAKSGVDQSAVDAWIAAGTLEPDWIVAAYLDGDSIIFDVTAPTGTGANYNGQYLRCVNDEDEQAPEINTGLDEVSPLQDLNVMDGVSIYSQVFIGFDWKKDPNSDGFIDGSDIGVLQGQMDTDVQNYFDVNVDSIEGDLSTPTEVVVTIVAPAGAQYNGKTIEVGTGSAVVVVGTPTFSGGKC